MNLYDCRIHFGLTPEALGKEVSVSPDTIRNLEAGGRPQTKTAHALTTYFSRRLGRIVPASELFPRDNVVPLLTREPKTAA